MTGAAPPRLEVYVLRHIEQLSLQFGLLCYHTHDSRHSAAGFPDVVVAGPGGVLFRELKSATGKVTAAQARWLETLVLQGFDTGVWTPADMTSGLIARRLQALRKAPTHA